jgi:hypothetical protein
MFVGSPIVTWQLSVHQEIFLQISCYRHSLKLCCTSTMTSLKYDPHQMRLIEDWVYPDPEAAIAALQKEASRILLEADAQVAEIDAQCKAIRLQKETGELTDDLLPAAEAYAKLAGRQARKKHQDTIPPEADDLVALLAGSDWRVTPRSVRKEHGKLIASVWKPLPYLDTDPIEDAAEADYDEALAYRVTAWEQREPENHYTGTRLKPYIDYWRSVLAQGP